MAAPSNFGAGLSSLGKQVSQVKTLVQQSGFWARNGKMITSSLNEMVGPLGIAIALSFKFVTALGTALKTSQLIQKSLEAYSKMEYYTPSFTRLLGGLSAAKQRLGDLAKMAANGPFKFDSLVQANRRLEILTRGMAAGAKEMQVVQDAAAAGGVAPEQAAEGIGGAMKAIAERQGIDETIKSLADMGIISVSSADKIRNLADAGASETKMLEALNIALDRNKGASKQLGDTLVGLSQQIAGAANANMQNIGGLFAEGSAAGMRAGLTILKEYGPVLVDLMKPVAAIYNAWNKFVEGLAQIASIGVVKQTIQTLIVLLGVLSTAFAMKGVQLAVQGIAQLAGWLTKLAIPAARAASGMGIVRVAAVTLGRGLYAALGPIGLLAAALAALAEVWGAFGGDKGGGASGAIQDLVKDTKDGNDAVAKMVSAAEKSGDLGDKSAAVAAASEQVDKARKNKRAADAKTAGGGARGMLGDVAAGAAIGATLGSFVPVVGTAIGGGIGAVAGAGMNVYRRGQDEKAKQDAAEEERIAQENMDKANKANVLTPADYINDVDYQKAQAEGQRKLQDLQSKRQGYIGAGGGEGDDYVKDLDKQIKQIGAGVSPEALKKAFNMRMAEEQTKVTGMRATAGGDQAQLLEADRLEAQMKTDGRAKELKAMGIETPKAEQMAKVEGLSSMAEAMAARGQVRASSRASVGGAVGEAAGGVPPEFQKIIDEIRKIQGDLQQGNNSDNHDRIQSTLSQ